MNQHTCLPDEQRDIAALERLDRLLVRLQSGERKVARIVMTQNVFDSLVDERITQHLHDQTTYRDIPVVVREKWMDDRPDTWTIQLQDIVLSEDEA